MSDDRTEIIVAGDINVNTLDDRAASWVDDFCKSTHTRQVVDFPTHKDALLDGWMCGDV